MRGNCGGPATWLKAGGGRGAESVSGTGAGGGGMNRLLFCAMPLPVESRDSGGGGGPPVERADDMGGGTDAAELN